MPDHVLVYNGTSYALPLDVARALLDRGVIATDPSGDADYVLCTEHLIDEIEPLAVDVQRSDVPAPPHLGGFRLRSPGPLDLHSPLALFPPATNRIAPRDDDRRDG